MRFEGEFVDGLRLTIRQFKGDIETPLAVDEIIHLHIQAKVTHVSHEVNERDGRLYRTHVVKVLEADVG